MPKISPDFEWPGNWQPDLSATLMFIVHEGKVLLIRKKRGIGAGKVNGPGGKFEPGETALECVLREVREELNIHVSDARELGLLRFSFRCGTIPEICCHVFLGTEFEGTPEESAEADPFWCPADEIPFDRMWQDDQLWLPDLLQGHAVNAWFVFDGDEMIQWKVQVDECTLDDGKN